MRKRLSLLVAATTSAVVLAFLIPLAVLIRGLGEERAIGDAQDTAQTLAVTAVTGSTQQLAALISNAVPYTITVQFDDGRQIGQLVDDPQLALSLHTGRAFTRDVASSTTGTPAGKAVYVPAAGSNNGRAVRVAVRVVVPEATLRSGVNEATLIITGLAALSLVVAVVAADQLARRLAAPILDVAAAADRLREGHLDARAPEEGTHEVVTLARALNGLAERIEQLLASERDAVADLSHRLRTPVTALRLDSDGVEDSEMAERLRTHVAHLERTVDAIVRDARRPVRTPVAPSCDVGRVVAERVAFWSALADDQSRSLGLSLPEGPVRANLQAPDLADVVDALIDNAFAHTSDGVPIEVSVADPDDGVVTLTVEDAGPGWPPGDVVSRGSSGAGSTGLGLDIVRRTALSTGGGMELDRSRLGGALVRVRLGRSR
jgi:signal transduction histidine kinase